jgi:hypothetical protein
LYPSKDTAVILRNKWTLITLSSHFQALLVIEDSPEYLVDLEAWDLSAPQVNQGMLECLDCEGQRVSASKEKGEMMVRNVAIK